jgi:hypothetical protein
MATTSASATPTLAPDYGPSLPALLRRRFGFRERVTTAVALALLLLVAGIALLVVYLTGPERIVYRAGPTFNLQYGSDVLHRVPPLNGELVRLEGRRGRLAVSITVTPLRLPAYAGNVTSGLLPAYEDGYERRLRASLRASGGDFVKRDEGSARVNDAQGYQVGFRTGPAGRFTWGRDILLVPEDENVRDGVVLHLRQTKQGTLTKRDEKFLGPVRRALKSFNFGTDRAEW